MEAEAIAELDAENSDDEDCYITRPDNGFTPPKGFVYVDHYNRFTTTNCLGPDNFYKPGYLCAAHVVGIADPAMYGNHSSHNNQEHYNRQLKIQKDKLKDEIRAIQADRRNALDTLAYERAKFRADCAARNIRTSEDAERAFIRVAVARADVVSQDVSSACMCR